MDLRPPERPEAGPTGVGAGRPRTVDSSAQITRGPDVANRRSTILTNKLWRTWLLSAVMGLAGCSDSGVNPSRDTALQIHLEADPIGEVAVAVGDSVRLTLRFVGDGETGAAAQATWEVENLDVAQLSDATSSGVYVRGVAFGSTRVIASAQAESDTIVVSVLSPGLGGWCDGDGLVLTRGQSITTTAAAGTPLCIAPIPEDGVEYVIVPFNATLTGQRLRVEVSSAVSGTSMLSPEEGEDVAIAERSLRLPERDFAGEFDRRLRESEARDLRPLVRRATPDVAASMAMQAIRVPAIGEEINLNVNADQTCSSPRIRRARVMAVGTHSVMLEDLSNPTGGFTSSDYEQFVAAFDSRVYPTIVRNFGEPTDIDANGRILVLFTSAVNELTESGSDSYVAGFFFARDLFPTKDSGGMQGCGGSNMAELLYMLAPDPTGQINGNIRAREAVAQRSVGIFGHEMQHLVSASRRLRILRIDNWNEEFWLNEALSHIAEELLFYEATPFGPGEEITITRLRSTAGGTSRFNEYQASNFGRYISFLRDPAAASPLTGMELATRGAGWAFLRYAADRQGGDESALWRRLIDSGATGYVNLLGALGSSPLAWMHDWSVALYTDDAVVVPSRYRQPSWHFRSIIPTLSSTGGVYPLAVSDLASSGQVTFDLAAGGTGIVRLRVPRDRARQLTITSNGAVAPSQLRFTIVRTR